MSMSQSAVAVPERERGRDHLKLSCVTGLAALSDILFWQERLGISAALMVLALMTAIVVVNASRLGAAHRVGALMIAALTLAPLIENISPLSVLFGAFGIAAFALVATGQLNERWPHVIVAPIKLLLLGPFRLLPDMEAILQRQGGVMGRIGGLVRWVVPVSFGCVFLGLFAAANPMIESWLARIDLRALADIVANGRVVFWIAAAFGVWGLVCVRDVLPLKRWRAHNALPNTTEPVAQSMSSAMASQVFGHGAIVRSLLLFNVLFAVQTVLDIAFLWRGAALPAGMSYASYAHRGAYPLMITAALAAAFVVRAFGPGSTLERSRLARVLVFAWIGQNVLLVLSSILRLDLYVDVYALSYWRVAAFVWMGLVAVGLVFICVRIALHRTNAWLVGANVAAALAVLYACCFINFAKMIADYNVDHSREISGRGLTLDRAYLGSLGPHAIPAMDRMIAAGVGDPNMLAELVEQRKACTEVVVDAVEHWRTWTRRDAALYQFLLTQGRAKFEWNQRRC